MYRTHSLYTDVSINANISVKLYVCICIHYYQYETYIHPAIHV